MKAGSKPVTTTLIVLPAANESANNNPTTIPSSEAVKEVAAGTAPLTKKLVLAASASLLKVT